MTSNLQGLLLRTSATITLATKNLQKWRATLLIISLMSVATRPLDGYAEIHGLPLVPAASASPSPSPTTPSRTSSDPATSVPVRLLRSGFSFQSNSASSTPGGISTKQYQRTLHITPEGLGPNDKEWVNFSELSREKNESRPEISSTQRSGKCTLDKIGVANACELSITTSSTVPAENPQEGSPNPDSPPSTTTGAFPKDLIFTRNAICELDSLRNAQGSVVYAEKASLSLMVGGTPKQRVKVRLTLRANGFTPQTRSRSEVSSLVSGYSSGELPARAIPNTYPAFIVVPNFVALFPNSSAHTTSFEATLPGGTTYDITPTISGGLPMDTDDPFIAAINCFTYSAIDAQAELVEGGAE